MANDNKNNKKYLVIGIVALVLVVLSGGSITAASVFDFFGMNEPAYEVTQDIEWQDDEAEMPEDSEEAEQTVVIRYEFRKKIHNIPILPIHSTTISSICQK